MRSRSLSTLVVGEDVHQENIDHFLYLLPLMTTNLSVNLNGLHFKNPLMLASGIFLPHLYESGVDLQHLGALVAKTVWYEPRGGNPKPWLYESPFMVTQLLRSAF